MTGFRKVTSLIAIIASHITSHVSAQSDSLVLARICAHEAGYTAYEDCAAIHTVLSRGAERHHRTFRDEAYAYSGMALRRETSRPWYAELDERGREPYSWPIIMPLRCRDGICEVRRAPSWSRYRSLWLLLLATARLFVSGDKWDACTEWPDHWGGSMDREGALENGLREIDCGDTENDFWVIDD
jgi:hypothetical protein